MTTHDTSTWTRVSGAMGSNPGGVYVTLTGEYYYLKHTKSADHARNEILASRLYALADTACITVEPTTVDTVIVSRMVNDARAYLGHRLHDVAYIAKIRAGFAVDAWLANWDIAGLVFDNVVSDEHDNPVRVDTGGCLLFRAMGSPKGSAFGPVAGELDTLRTAPEAGRLFGTMTEQEIAESAKSLESVTSEQIATVVESVGFDPIKSDHLIAVLVARRADILARVA